MKLVSLYEKWDRKWNSLGEFYYLQSFGSLSPGFLLLSCKMSRKNATRGTEERDG